MATALAMLLTAAGLYLFFSKLFVIGLGLLGLAFLSWKHHTPISELHLEQVLWAVASLGVIVATLEDLVNRFLLS